MRRDNKHILVLVLIFIFGALVPVEGGVPNVPVLTLDSNFGPVVTRAGGFVSAAAVQPDGKVVLAGGFNAINGTARNGIARVATDGTVDTTFATIDVCCAGGVTTTDVSVPISALALQSDGKVLLGGSFTNVAGVVRNGIARLNADGTLDSTFNPGTGLSFGAGSGGGPPVVAIVIQPDGKLLVGGYFTAINGVSRNGLARLNADGSLDTTFNPGSGLAIGDPTDAGRLTGLALLPSGQIIIAGAFRSFNAVLRDGLARLNADGSVDPAFAPALGLQDGIASIDSLLVQPDGQMIISGSFDEVNNETRSGMARISQSGVLDPALDPSIDTANFESFALLGLQADGKMIVYHQFTDSSSNSHRTITRLSSTGSIDPTFNLDLLPGEAGRLTVSGIAPASGGNLLIFGNFFADPTGTHEGIVRTGPNGNVDPSFNPRFELAESVDPNVASVAVQADDKVLIGGTFNLVNGVPRAQLARLNTDGTLDMTFAPIVQADDPRSSVAVIRVQPDGKVLIGGLFTTVNGASRNGVARLNADGTLDSSFDPGSGTAGTGVISALAPQPDGKVLVGGNFTALNAVPLLSLGRLATNGAVDLTFGSPFGDCNNCSGADVHGIGVLSNGVVMVSGNFSTVEAFTVNGLARLGPDGSADINFTSSIKAEEQVTAMVVSTNDQTVVAVSSSDPSGVGNRSRFLRFNSDGTLDSSWNAPAVIGDGTATPPVAAMALDAQGRLVIAGQFTSVSGTNRLDLARLNSDGSLDTTFDAGAGFASGAFQGASNSRTLVTSLGLQSNGGIIVGGTFARVNDQVRLGLVRYQADASSGPPSGGGTFTVQGVARATDGTVSFQITGETGKTYRVDASSDLRTWTALGTIVGLAIPQLFTDSSAKNLAWRFYRVVAQ